MAEIIVATVAGKLTDLLAEEDQLDGVKDEIEKVVEELSRMMTFLPDADSRISERKLIGDVQKLAYVAEHVVNSFLVKTSSFPGKAMQWINKWFFLRKIADIQRKMSILSIQFRNNDIRSTLESPKPPSETRIGKLRRFYSYSVVEPDYYSVGSQEDVDRLVGHLVDETDGCYPLISICGMGGLGKTHLAQKIYNHSTIKINFAGLAWVSISKKWQTKYVLQRILICLIHERKEEILKMDDDMLMENLQKIQQKKKCLIVLDDIWSTDAWDSIKPAFPAENSRSRLMATTRKFKVAEYINPKGLIHQPESLDAEESWKLLMLKALPHRDYLDTRDLKKMEELGRKMVRNCAGVPLDIAILGGFLVTKPSFAEWEKFYGDSLSSLKLGKRFGERYQNELSSIYDSSYNDLPPRLKPYFQYLG